MSTFSIKKIFKWVLRITGGVILLLILIWFLLQITGVQNWVAKRITNTLQKKLDTEVRIDYVKFKFFSDATLNGIFIADQKGDTLLYASELDIDFSLFQLFRKKMHIKSISLHEAIVNLHTIEEDTIFNHDFILTAFSSEETDTTASKGFQWEIELKNLVLDQIDFIYADVLQDFRVDSRIETAHINFRAFKLPKKEILLSDLYLANSNTFIRTNVPTSPSEGVSSFPSIGWSFGADQVYINNFNFAYDNEAFQSTRDQFDPRHFNLEEINLFLTDAVYNDTLIEGFLEEGYISDKNGFEISEFSTRFSLSGQKLVAQDLKAISQKSNLSGNAELSFAHFESLSFFEDSVQINLDLDWSLVHYDDLNYLLPQWKNWGLDTRTRQIIGLRGQLSGTISNLYTPDLELKIGKQFVTRLRGRILGLPNTDQMVFDGDFRSLQTSYTHLKKLMPGIRLPEGIQNWGNINLKGAFRTSPNSLTGRSLVIKTDGATAFEGDFEIRNLQSPEALQFEFDIKRIASRSEDLVGFLSRELPDPFNRLGTFSYEGTLKGDAHNYNIDGILKSQYGTGEADLEIAFTDDYKNASYSGEIKLDTFDLGHIFDNPDLGTVSIDLLASGEGLNEQDINANLKGHIRSFIFRDYRYEDLFVDGRLIRKKFIGRAQLTDPNLSFTADGLADMDGATPDFIFNMQLDTIAPQALNLINQPYQFKGSLFANLIGDQIDNVVGEFIAEEFSVTTPEGTYQTPMVRMAASTSNQQRRIDFESEIMEAFIEGHFKVLEIPRAFISAFDHYFNISHLDTIRALDEYGFDFGCSLSNPIPLTSLFFPDLTLLDSALIRGTLYSPTQTMSLYCSIPAIQYRDISANRIQLYSLGDTKKLTNRLTSGEVSLSPGTTLPSSDVNIDMARDTATIDLTVKNLTDSTKQISLSGAVYSLDSLYAVHVDSTLKYSTSTWKIDPRNRLTYQGNKIFIEKLNLIKPGQEILISTIPKRAGDIEPPIEIGLRQFKLSEISMLLGRKQENFYEGRAIGNILIQNPLSDFSFLADMNIEELSLNDQLIGMGYLSARQRTATEVDVEIDLFGKNNRASVLGTYQIDNAIFDLTADIQQLELRIADPFLEHLISDSKGSLHGSFDIIGQAYSPEINGSLQFVDASTMIEFLQTRYQIRENKINFKGKTINLGQITFLDPNENLATVEGTIQYQNIRLADLNLQFYTDRFQIINTTSKDNQLFFGKIFARGDAQIGGNTDRPVINAKVTSLDSTDFFIQPFSVDARALNEDFIIFANPETYAGDTTIDMNELYQLSDLGVDLTANITITPEARLQIVVDPTTGDQLVCYGNADLVFNMNADGNLAIFGTYTLTEGQYTLVFQKVLKKEFEIEPGSTVSFIGDPLDSRFNINAKYKVSTPTYPLIANESSALTEFELRNAKEKSDVEVLLNFTGDLAEPLTSLDIVIPDNQTTGQIGGAVEVKLSQLRDNESDLNLQIFSLLIFEAFVSLESSNDNFVGTAGVNAGLSTVSNLLTKQLNLLAKRFIKGVDLDFGVDSYRSGYDNTTITELQVGMRKRLLNDRLSIYVGGSVNNEAQQYVDLSTKSNSTYSGDFVIEYKLTEDGNYQLRFYQLLSNEQTEFSQGANYYEAGIAIFFKKSFNSKRYRLKQNEPNEE